MSTEDAWTTVTRKSSRSISRRDEARLQRAAAKTNLGEAARARELELDDDELTERVDALRGKIRRAREDVERASFVRRAVDAIESAVRARSRGRRATVLALGLGSPSTSAATRCQLAFATVVAEALSDASETPARVLAYDPCFTLVDERAMKAEAACETLDRTRCDAYVEATTNGDDDDGFLVFYMPHCEGHLYESVVQARWSVQGMREFVCVGNTFETYAERWKTKNADPEKKRPSRVIAASSIANSMLVDPGDTFVVQGAFNDTSVQTFDVDKLLPVFLEN